MEVQKNAAIELRNITKTFGKVVANKNVSLRVNRGRTYSFNQRTLWFSFRPDEKSI